MISNSGSTGIAIVGCGIVGGATANILTRDANILAARTGLALQLRHIIDLDFTHAKSLNLDESLYSSDYQAAIADESVSIVVELVGGLTVAKDIIIQALDAGKSVVTANKALLAHCGTELYSIARANSATIAFEASCGGGIPIIRALLDGLVANRIDAFYGILNGTCNYILTAMTGQNQSYEQALSDAQKIGLAEADPTLDVSGVDSAHKLAIMSSLAFGKQIDFDAIEVEGIDSLAIYDINFGLELGYVIKLLAIAQRAPEGLRLRVRPVFISEQHPLAWVSGPFNAISVYGHATGHTMYYGRGAGAMPTASAVVADISSIAMGINKIAFNSLPLWPDRCEQASQLPIEAVNSRYYLRMVVDDSPGALAMIATILGDHDISIASVLQHEHCEVGADTGAIVVITTSKANEGAMRLAINKVNAMNVVKSECVCIGIVDEHPEQVGDKS